MKNIDINLEGIIGRQICEQASDFHIGFYAGSNVTQIFFLLSLL